MNHYRQTTLGFVEFTPKGLVVIGQSMQVESLGILSDMKEQMLQITVLRHPSDQPLDVKFPNHSAEVEAIFTAWNDKSSFQAFRG